jgi:2-(1,2-epoxy-1,2-dihydrophenyl)acetyl-CoA isomerase
MSDDAILVERDGALGWIRINRPERLNAFSGDMRQRIESALRQLDADDDVRVVLITGVGRAFCTGGDIQVMTKLAEQRDTESFRDLVEAGERVVTVIEEMDKPVIAVLNGPAAGAGACLALACDLRIASEAASIGFTFVRVGQHPDWGGTYWLPRLVGPALAARGATRSGQPHRAGESARGRGARLRRRDRARAAYPDHAREASDPKRDERRHATGAAAARA